MMGYPRKYERIVLDYLRSHGGPHTTAEMAEALGVPSHKIRGACVTLEGKNAVRRQPQKVNGCILWEAII